MISEIQIFRAGTSSDHENYILQRRWCNTWPIHFISISTFFFIELLLLDVPRSESRSDWIGDM